jgi:hypothetical protein
MLYQVSKKYAGMPQVSAHNGRNVCMINILIFSFDGVIFVKARSSSFYTLASLHLRLWKLHETLHASIQHSIKPHSDCKEHLLVAESKLSPANFHHIADFPLPQDFHTLQFSRLLIGVLNNCVTVLMQAKQYSVRAPI